MISEKSSMHILTILNVAHARATHTANNQHQNRQRCRRLPTPPPAPTTAFSRLSRCGAARVECSRWGYSTKRRRSPRSVVAIATAPRAIEVTVGSCRVRVSSSRRPRRRSGGSTEPGVVAGASSVPIAIVALQVDVPRSRISMHEAVRPQR